MRKLKYFSVLLLILADFAVIGLRLTQAQRPVPGSAGGERIPGQYIVVFKDNVADPEAAAQEIVKARGLGHLFTYSRVIKGFAATIPDVRLDAVKSHSRVQFVSEDRIVYALGKFESTDSGRVIPFARPAVQQAQTIPTGISRIAAPSSTSKGTGVAVAVIDTGIDLTHPDLKANIANSGKTCVNRTYSANDDNGHGTHVAGIIAALDNSIGVVGVAPQAKLIPVKVLDRTGSGTWSSVICGIDWVTANASSLGIKVANMSLGGTGTSDNNCGNTNSDALHKAVCRSRDAGVTYVVAAGNESGSASKLVPAAYDDAVITVSALADSDGKPGGLGPKTSYGPDDTFATFSNYGSIVDLGAPGVSIYSTYKGGKYATMSGTSMASPHVAGVAALYISGNPGSTWIQVRDGLKALGEALGFGHTDPSGLHPELVVKADSL